MMAIQDRTQSMIDSGSYHTAVDDYISRPFSLSSGAALEPITLISAYRHSLVADLVERITIHFK